MLKKIGFNEACEYCFDSSKNDPIDRLTPTDVFGNEKHNSSDPYLVACPSLDDAVEWIWRYYKIDIQVHTVPNTPLYFFSCYGLPFITDGLHTPTQISVAKLQSSTL